MDRRSFLRLAPASAAIILTPGLLMPVREIAKPYGTPHATLEMIQQQKWVITQMEKIINPPLRVWQDGIEMKWEPVHYSTGFTITGPV